MCLSCVQPENINEFMKLGLTVEQDLLLHHLSVGSVHVRVVYFPY